METQLFTSLKDASNESLLALKEQNVGCESVVSLVDSIIEAREREGLAELAKVEFSDKVKELVNLPEPPSDVHNLFLTWAQVEIPEGEAEEVEIIGDKGKKVKEMRQPVVKVWQWVITVNHACKVGKSVVGAKATPKRAIAVYKRDGLSLNPVGNFANGKDACDFLKLEVGGDSALRVLGRDGYIVEPFDGTL